MRLVGLTAPHESRHRVTDKDSASPISEKTEAYITHTRQTHGHKHGRSETRKSKNANRQRHRVVGHVRHTFDGMRGEQVEGLGGKKGACLERTMRGGGGRGERDRGRSRGGRGRSRGGRGHHANVGRGSCRFQLGRVCGREFPVGNIIITNT